MFLIFHFQMQQPSRCSVRKISSEKISDFHSHLKGLNQMINSMNSKWKMWMFRLRLEVYNYDIYISIYTPQKKCFNCWFNITVNLHKAVPKMIKIGNSFCWGVYTHFSLVGIVIILRILNCLCLCLFGCR